MQPRKYIDPSDFAGVYNDDKTTENGMTAATTQSQAAGTRITRAVSRFTTVANSGDAATLPPAVAGEKRVVLNKGAQSLSVFPAPGDKINALSADAAYALAATKSVIFYCAVDGTWDTLLTA